MPLGIIFPSLNQAPPFKSQASNKENLHGPFLCSKLALPHCLPVADVDALALSAAHPAFRLLPVPPGFTSGTWFSSQKLSSLRRGQKYPFPSKAAGTVKPGPPLPSPTPELSDRMCLSLYLTQLPRMQKRPRHVLQGLKESRRQRKKVDKEKMKEEMRDITVAKVPLVLMTFTTLIKPHALAQTVSPSSVTPWALSPVKHKNTKAWGPQRGLWHLPPHQWRLRVITATLVAVTTNSSPELCKASKV